MDINSVEVVTLGSFPDRVGLFGRRKDAAVSRILQGRDSRSVRFLVPDARGLDQNFHDVTIVDMDDEREPTVTPVDMTRLRELWPPEIFNQMRWFQQDLELMRKSAKWEFSQLRPMPCKFCGKVIRVDMYRHVARLHLDLVQLWRCPIAWCNSRCGKVLLRTVWSMYEMATMFRGSQRPPVLRSMPHHGLYVVSYGRIPCVWNIPAFPPTSCYSASWDCR